MCDVPHCGRVVAITCGWGCSRGYCVDHSHGYHVQHEPKCVGAGLRLGRIPTFIEGDYVLLEFFRDERHAIVRQRLLYNASVFSWAGGKEGCLIGTVVHVQPARHVGRAYSVVRLDVQTKLERVRLFSEGDIFSFHKSRYLPQQVYPLRETSWAILGWFIFCLVVLWLFGILRYPSPFF